MAKNHRSPHGFTLVELLVVIGIIAILSAISIPSVVGIVRSSSLTSGGNMLSGQLNTARQYAMSKNCQVEFRLYQLPDPATPAVTTPTVFRAFQAFALASDGVTVANALTKIVFLPNQIYMVPNGAATVSSLLQVNPPQTSPSYVQGVTAGVALGTFPPASYNYYAFHFKPDGSTDLDPNSAQTSFVTLANQHVANVGSTGLPANFVTLQINSLTGRVNYFRPN